MNRAARKTIGLSLSFAAALAVTLTQPAPTQAQDAAASGGGRARVLVAPLKSGAGVKKDFGKKVSEEVQKQLRDFPTLTAIESNAVRDELKRLKLNEDDLGLIQWRQLAGRLDADLVMYGEVARTGGGNAVDVSFVDPRSGDQLEVPEFTVPGDGKDEVQQAAGVIVGAFEGQVEYQRSLLFCQDYLSAQQYEDALRNCEDALARNPGSTTAHYSRGRAYMGLEQWQQARADLSTVVEENPAEVLALQSLAFTEAKLGNTERATELYREYLNFNPGDASVRMKVAFDLATAGALDPAIALLEDGVEVDPSNPDLWQYLGDFSLQKGTAAGAEQGAEATITDVASVERAVEAYERVFELRGEETKPDLFRNVIAAHLALGDCAEAQQFANRALGATPNDAQLWSVSADVFNKCERPAEAVTAMDKVLSIDPEYPNAYAKRGFFKLAAGQSEDAISDLRRAVEEGTDPDVVAQQMLGRGYNGPFKEGNYDEAIRMFQVGTEFAKPGRTRDQLYFFTAYGYFQQGVAIDAANDAEACDPARRALSRFEQVIPNLNRAGDEQPKAQSDIRENTDVYLYRQQQIIRKACQ